MKEIFVVGIKFVTNEASIVLVLLSEENCDVEAQEQGFAYQTSLLYFLTLFYHQPAVGCRHLSVVG